MKLWRARRSRTPGSTQTAHEDLRHALPAHRRRDVELRHKRQALVDYLRLAVGDPEQYASAAWTVYFLAGGKPRQMISTKLLRQLALEATDLPEWLLDEC